MSGVQTDLLPVLQWLTATLNDGADCFRLAAEDARSEEIHAFFDRLCRQRLQFVAELTAIARQLGAVSLDRDRPDARPLSGFFDDRALLTECNRYEQEAAFAYRHALGEGDLPGNIRQVLERHAAEIAEAASQLCHWENQIPS